MLLNEVSEICDELQVCWGAPGKRSRSACFHGWALALRAPVGAHALSECHSRKRQTENWLFIVVEKPHPGRSGRQRLRRRAARRASRRRCARPGLWKPCRPARTAPRAPAWPSCRRAARCAAAPAPDLARWGVPRERTRVSCIQCKGLESSVINTRLHSNAHTQPFAFLCLAQTRGVPLKTLYLSCPARKAHMIQHPDCHCARLQYSWQCLTRIAALCCWCAALQVDKSLLEFCRARQLSMERAWAKAPQAH